jgi:DNA-binding transcriptional regulator YiaG
LRVGPFIFARRYIYRGRADAGHERRQWDRLGGDACAGRVARAGGRDRWHDSGTLTCWPLGYKYTECGLDNVTIKNMPAIVDDAGEEVYEIRNVLGLHRVIATCIVRHPRGISPKELRFLRTEMGLTQAELAEIVKKDHQTIGRWERGETPIDQNAEALIRLMTAEKLDLARTGTIEEVARACVPTAEMQVITIDGGDPRNYQALPTAA